MRPSAPAFGQEPDTVTELDPEFVDLINTIGPRRAQALAVAAFEVAEQIRADADLLGTVGAGWHQVTSELGFERSGPERFLSTATMLFALVEALRDDLRAADYTVDGIHAAMGETAAAALGRELLGGSLPAQYKDIAWCRELAADTRPWLDKPADPVPEGPVTGGDDAA